MIEHLTLTVVVNNFVEESRYWAEHGLSILLSFVEEGAEKKVLIDTGQSGDVLIHNLTELKIAPDSISTIIISHGHYDHTGGLLKLLRHTGQKTEVVLHPGIWGTRLNLKPFTREIGTEYTKESIERAGGEIVTSETPVFLTKQIFTTGAVQRTETFEYNDSFQMVSNGKCVHDDIVDDISVIVDLGEEGLFIVTGCCHAGIVNTVKHSMKITGNNKIKGIAGGLHLKAAGKERITKTIDYLKEIGPATIIPLHCSGLLESFSMREAIGESVELCGVGSEIRIL